MLKSKYETSDSAGAILKGRSATGEIFRYNPGKDEIIFPPKHPYNKIAEKAKPVINAMIDDDSKAIIRQYKNGGKIATSLLVDKSATDYGNVIKCCEHFAKKGKQTELLPKVPRNSADYEKYFKELIGTKYEGKCPDFKVENKYYELEGYVTSHPEKNALSNMLSGGVKQSNNIIIMDEGSTNRHLKKHVYLRQQQGQDIKELWVLRKEGTLEQVY